MNSQMDAPPGRPAGNRNTIIAIVVGVLLLCCCCVGAAAAYWLWFNGDAMFGITSLILSSLA